MDRQQRIDFETTPESRERFRQRCKMIEAMSASNTGLSTKRVRAIQKLVHRLWKRFSDDNGIGTASCAVIAADLITDDRTVKRWFAWAESLGVLTLRTWRNRRGYRRRRYFIEWDRLEGLTKIPSGVSSEPGGVSAKPGGVSSEPGGVSSPFPIGTPLGSHISPTPKKATMPVRPCATRPSVSAEWEGVAGEFAKVGVGIAEQLAAEARDRGLTPAEAVEAAKLFTANRPKFRSTGALAFRIRNGRWPTDEPLADPAAVEAARRKRVQSQAAERQRTAAAIAERDRQRCEYKSLNSQFGHQLDAMPLDQLREHVSGEFELQQFLKDRTNVAARYPLLVSISISRKAKP